MKTFILLEKSSQRSLPKEYQSDDNRFAEHLVEYFLKKYTKAQDKVIDIFAGLGTTLFVAEALGRIPFGIEYDQQRVEYIRSNISSQSTIILGDALDLTSMNLPKMDFAITSPPYMHKDEILDPLSGYSTKGDYKSYLNRLKKIFAQLKTIMNEGAFLVIEVSNLKGEEITTLAWDIAKRISKVLHFHGELIVGWQGENTGNGTYGYGYDHSYCLVFQKK